MDRTQFTFYESFYKALSRIRSGEERAFAYDAICAYALYGTEPDMDKLQGSAAIAFESVRETIEADRRMSSEGRRCAEYKEWRKAVFERDKYTCQMCGEKGVRLNAHHKKEYAFFPELRYELGNGITLCVNCHKMVHRRMRRGD